jgi:hypothetical protein
MLTSKEVGELCRRARVAFSRTDQMRGILEEAYRLGNPNREGFNRGAASGAGQDTHGERKAAKVYDPTYADCVNRLTNQLVDGMFPPWAKWFSLAPGVSVPEEQKDALGDLLRPHEDVLWQTIATSNFSQAIHPYVGDLVFSTGAMMIEPDGVDGVVFTPVSPWELGLEAGDHGKVGNKYRSHMVGAGRIEEEFAVFGSLNIPTALAKIIKETPEQMVRFETCITCYERKWWQHLIWPTGPVELGTIGPFRTDPMPVARWSVLTGEVFGRGPALDAYPTAYTLNELYRLALINANLSAYGMYTVVDDGVARPQNIIARPMAMIPVASNDKQNPTLRLMERDKNAITLADWSIDDLRSLLRQTMMVDDLGNVEGQPKTATEIVERQSRIQKDKGAAFGRLTAEGSVPFIARVMEIQQDRGLIPRELSIDGKVVTVKPVSPLARAQDYEDVQRARAFMADAANAAALDPGAVAIPRVGAILRRIGNTLGIRPEEMLDDAEATETVAQGMASGLAQLPGPGGAQPLNLGLPAAPTLTGGQLPGGSML